MLTLLGTFVKNYSVFWTATFCGFSPVNVLLFCWNRISVSSLAYKASTNPLKTRGGKEKKHSAYETVDWWLLSHREDTLICRLCQERVNVHDFGLKVLVHSMNRMKMRNKNRKTWMSASRPGQEPKQVVAGCAHHKDNHIGGLWKQLITTRFLLGSDLQQQQRR